MEAKIKMGEEKECNEAQSLRFLTVWMNGVCSWVYYIIFIFIIDDLRCKIENIYLFKKQAVMNDICVYSFLPQLKHTIILVTKPRTIHMNTALFETIVAWESMLLPPENENNYFIFPKQCISLYVGV